MIPALLFLPALAFYAYLVAIKKVTYKNAVIPLIVAYLAYSSTAVFLADTPLPWWVYPLQGLGGAVVFFLAVSLIGHISSPEAVLCVIGSAMIVPLIWPAVAVFGGGTLLAVLVALARWNRTEQHKLTLSGAVFQSLLSLGVGMRISPDLDSVPRAADHSAAVKVSTSPWFLIATVLTGAAYVAIQALL